MKRASFMKNSPLSRGIKPRNRWFRIDAKPRLHDGSFQGSILDEERGRTNVYNESVQVASVKMQHENVIEKTVKYIHIYIYRVIGLFRAD